MSIIQVNEKIKSNFYNSNYNSQQYLSTFASPKTMPKNLISSKIKEKQRNLLDFITQKNKFKMKKFFDQKTTKKFLESKNLAMMELNLDDESDELYNKEYESYSTKKKFKNKRAKTRNKYIAKNTFTPAKNIRASKTGKNMKVMSDINSINKANKENAKKINLFIFSKSTRDLMINDDDIEVSSISKESNSRRNEIKKDRNSKNNKDKKELEINKCNESLFSIMSNIL
jgi:hypothetical protein